MKYIYEIQVWQGHSLLNYSGVGIYCLSVWGITLVVFKMWSQDRRSESTLPEQYLLEMQILGSYPRSTESEIFKGYEGW